MTTKITEKNISELANAGVNWQSVFTGDGSTGLTAVAGRGYFIDTTSGTVTATLPGSPSAGDTIAIKDYAGTFGTNNLTIGRNGNNIQGVANDSLISTNRASIVLVYIDATKGWLYTNESNVIVSPYVSATGGTVTTSGDFKIHTFTGDGCFVVSNIGAGIVDYLVVAGGASGGGYYTGGGGGAGGYRESHSTPVSGCYTASPLATPTGITVSATTYPITVGGGGASVPYPNSNESGNSGSNSVFSTITSTGGGGGGGGPAVSGLAGGSGGGGSRGPAAGGTGNTPPVSPPQGNNGGSGSPLSGNPAAGGGGGGATENGAGGNPGTGGNGGTGGTTSISGSPTAYAGGGGGGNYTGSGGTGGTGGGGNGANSSGGATSASANTGGGGGGVGIDDTGAGGKGIVIIRYKYQ